MVFFTCFKIYSLSLILNIQKNGWGKCFECLPRPDLAQHTLCKHPSNRLLCCVQRVMEMTGDRLCPGAMSLGISPA